MNITYKEFEEYFAGGLTPERRGELFVAILTDSTCAQIATAFLLADELDSLSAFDEVAEVEPPQPGTGGQLLSFIKATGAFIAYTAPCGMTASGISLNERIRAFRRKLEMENAGMRERDALLAKRVQEECFFGEAVRFYGDSEVAYKEICRIIEPVLQFWSNQFDKGMFSRGAARACADKLLRKPSLSLFKHYNPSEGSFATYFDKALRNELKRERAKEIKKSFFNKERVENIETCPKDRELMVDGNEVVEARMLQIDSNSIIKKIQQFLPKVEWNIFSARYMDCKKLWEIAEECKCSVSQASRISEQTMAKVRRHLGCVE